MDTNVDVHTGDPREVVVIVSGEIDLATRDDLQRAIETAVGKCDGRRIVVDLSRTTFLDSTGIATLVRGYEAATALPAEFRVMGAAGVVRQVLAVTGVLGALCGEPALQEQPDPL